MTEQFWLWLGFVGMSVGAGLVLFVGKSRTPQEQMTTIVHGIVPLIAACSYFAMATGQGSIVRHGGPGAEPEFHFYFARYIDWLFTTPMLLAELALTAMHTGLRRPGLLVGLIASDVLMIATAFFFGATDVFAIKWTWFAISCGAFLAIYYLIWGPLRAEARTERADIGRTYHTNAVLLSVIWFIYPVILLVDPDGLHWIGSTADVACIAIVDLAAKVAYGLFSVTHHARIADADLAESHEVRQSRA